MAEVYADAYALTKEKKYLDEAKPLGSQVAFECDGGRE
jgi:hypothetical protein